MAMTARALESTAVDLNEIVDEPIGQALELFNRALETRTTTISGLPDPEFVRDLITPGLRHSTRSTSPVSAQPLEVASTYSSLLYSVSQPSLELQSPQENYVRPVTNNGNFAREFEFILNAVGSQIREQMDRLASQIAAFISSAVASAAELTRDSHVALSGLQQISQQARESTIRPENVQQLIANMHIAEDNGRLTAQILASSIAAALGTFLQETVQNSDPSLESENTVAKAVNDVIGWLGLNQEEVANLLGVSLRTVKAWRREGVQPREALRLWRLHSAARTVLRAIGLEELRVWLGRGDPPPIEFLRNARLEEFELAVERTVPIQSQVENPYLSLQVANAEENDDQVVVRDRSPQRKSRKPVRRQES